MTVTAIAPLFHSMVHSADGKTVELRSAQFCTKYTFGDYTISCAYDTGGLSKNVEWGVSPMRRDYMQITKGLNNITKKVAEHFGDLIMTGDTEIVCLDDASKFLEIMNYVKELSEM